MKELDQMLNDPETIHTKKLKAIDVMIRTVRMCYSIVRDVDVEEIEDELEKIKEATNQPTVDFAPLPDTPPPK